jgi:hypothetical protein
MLLPVGGTIARPSRGRTGRGDGATCHRSCSASPPWWHQQPGVLPKPVVPGREVALSALVVAISALGMKTTFKA